eukprot:c45747_g1_i1 orf=9-263(-)
MCLWLKLLCLRLSCNGKHGGEAIDLACIRSILHLFLLLPVALCFLFKINLLIGRIAAFGRFKILLLDNSLFPAALFLFCSGLTK